MSAFAPSAITTKLRQAPAPGAHHPQPLPHRRQPRVSISKPARETSPSAPSSTESPMASGARPGLRSVFGRTCFTPPHAASAGRRTGQQRPPEPRPARSAPPFTTANIRCRARGLPVSRVRDLLPARAGPLVGADAAPARLEAVHPRRQLHVLRGRDGHVLPAAGRRHARQPGRGGAGAPGVERAAAPSCICAATVAIDLGVLGLYKYYGFFVDEFSGLLDEHRARRHHRRC